MENNQYLKDLIVRMRDLTQNTCNKVGCDNCGLSWDGGCSATDLQGKIMDEELKEAL